MEQHKLKLNVTWYQQNEEVKVGDKWYAQLSDDTEVTGIEITDITEFTVEFSKLTACYTVTAISPVGLLSTDRSRYLKTAFRARGAPRENGSIHLIERIAQ